MCYFLGSGITGTPEEKAAFAAAAEPVQAWFRENVDGGNEILDALIAAVSQQA